MTKHRTTPDLYRHDGETVPSWYPRIVSPSNVVWLHQRDHLVYDHWFPGVRSLYVTPFGRWGSAWCEVRFSRSLKIQIAIQENIHVSSSKARNMSVKGWANVTLGEEDKELIQSSDVSVETMLQDLGSLVFKGFRFSLTFDDYSNALQAALVCANPENPCYEYGLSARHPDPEIAIRSLLFKFAQTGNTPWSELTRERRVDNWS